MLARVSTYEGPPDRMEEGISYAGGTCSDGEDVPVTIPLDPITASEDATGSATTTIEDVTIGQLFDRRQDRCMHDEAYDGEGVPPAISCTDVHAPNTEQTTMKESTQPLPKSGGTPASSWLLPAAALLVGSGILGYAFLRHR